MTQSRQIAGEQSALSTTDRSRSAAGAVVSAIWRTLANPVLLLALTIVAFVLVLAALMTPQMPYPVHTDPAAAVRWLLNTSNGFGSMGELGRTVGLFNLLHSTLLRTLLVLIALMLAIQLADQIGAALILRGLPSRLDEPSGLSAAPISLPPGGPIYRARSALLTSVDALSRGAEEYLAERFGDPQHISINRIVLDGPDSNSEPRVDDEPNQEERFLAVRARTYAYLRPLLLLGLLVGLLALWLDVTFGWEVISPSLAPTESYQYPPRNLDIQYPTAVVDEAGFAIPLLQMTLDGRQRILAVAAADRVGKNRIITRPSVPALLVRTNSDDVLLARPGDSSKTESQAMGLSFPTPGSEASLILPDQGVGLRIIRRPATAGDDEMKENEDFSVEIYEANSTAPTRRVPLDEMKRQRIRVADGTVTLEFMPTVGVVVAVRSEPGSGLYWLAGILMIAGLVGFVRTPAYMLMQIGQWSPEKAYWIAQSNDNRELLSLETALTRTETEATEAVRPAPQLES